MSREFNTHEFGSRLKKLREIAYQKEPKRFSYCKTQQDFMSQLQFENLSDKPHCRQLLGNWENGKSIPSIPQLFALCNLLDCDIEYLLGCQPEVSANTKKIAETIGLSIESTEKLKQNSEVSQLVDYLLCQEKFAELCDYIEQEAIYHYIGNDLMIHFTGNLRALMKKSFDRALRKSSPYDDLEALYGQELKKSFSSNSLLERDILKDVSKDIKDHIQSVAEERGISLESEGYFDLIIDTLVSDSIQPLMHMAESKQITGRIVQMLTGIIEPYIKASATRIKANVKRNIP